LREDTIKVFQEIFDAKMSSVPNHIPVPRTITCGGTLQYCGCIGCPDLTIKDPNLLNFTDTPILQFVSFFEKNSKANETFVFFLQWTGNEDSLKLLSKACKKAYYDDVSSDDYSKVSIDINNLLSESVVDSICRVKCDLNDCNHLFNKCVGEFHSPFTPEEIELNDEYKLGQLLDEAFYRCKIKGMFRPS
jgi:hypothetical protein